MLSTLNPLAKFLLIILLLVAGGIGFRIWNDTRPEEEQEKRSERPIPVETEPVQISTLQEIRTFSGTLEPSADSQVAARVTGRVARIHADLSDSVTRGQVLAELDGAEYQQRVAKAEANVAVATARWNEAKNRLTIAEREQKRMNQLNERGVSSAASADQAEAEFLIRQSAVQVATSEMGAAKAELEAARIQLADTQVRAQWSEGDGTRILAARYVDEGDSVQANTSLFRVVEVQPLRAVISVPERDYRRLRPQQQVILSTDAWPEETFPASISRISPTFDESSRQARIEINVPNPDSRLKPGMFLRAKVVLDTAADAQVLPESALLRRNDTLGVFTVNQETATVSWIPVTLGIREETRVQVLSPEITGLVVTLGQHLLEEGSSVLLPEAEEDSP